MGQGECGDHCRGKDTQCGQRRVRRQQPDHRGHRQQRPQQQRRQLRRKHLHDRADDPGHQQGTQPNAFPAHRGTCTGPGQQRHHHTQHQRYGIEPTPQRGACPSQHGEHGRWLTRRPAQRQCAQRQHHADRQQPLACRQFGECRQQVAIVHQRGIATAQQPVRHTHRQRDRQQRQRPPGHTTDHAAPSALVERGTPCDDDNDQQPKRQHAPA